MPPRRRSERRVDAIPPGIGARVAADVDGREGTKQSYVAGSHTKRHRISTRSATFMAATVWAATFLGEGKTHLATWRLPLLCLAVVVFIFVRRGVVLFAVCVSVGLASGAAAWNVPVLASITPCQGTAQLITDPTPAGAGVRVVLRHKGQRLAGSAFGSPGRFLSSRSAGDVVVISGMCQPLSGAFARSERIRHIVGKVSLLTVSEEFSEGNVLFRSANRVRASMLKGVHDMSPTRQSLFTGLVVGDDRLQPHDMVVRFRESGLSHLCAASGQNVAYLLALASPLMRRKSALFRWGITMVIIVWFVVLTRAEPSVVRAGFMAAMVATNGLWRRPQNARNVLSWCVIALLVIDPMLAWSVSFGLSVGATAGLAWLSAPLGRMWGGRGVLASTVAAQIGTLPIAMVVFGSVPVVSLVANPLALPVAGMVMTIGLPLSLVGAALPVVSEPVSFLMSLPVLWVDSVALWGSRVALHGIWNTTAWGCVVVWGVVAWRRKRHV